MGCLAHTAECQEGQRLGESLRPTTAVGGLRRLTMDDRVSNKRLNEHLSVTIEIYLKISVMVANTPQILLADIEGLESKYEYIYFHMRIEENEFGLCERWVDMSLEEIMMRHAFLLRTGAYTTPDPKRPQFKMVRCSAIHCRFFMHAANPLYENFVQRC